MTMQSAARSLLCALVTFMPTRAQTPTNPLAYVSNSLDNSVSVIDLNAQKVIATIPVGMIPYGLQISPDGRFLYTINRGNGSLGTNAGSDISVVSTATNKVVATINLNNPDGFAIAGIVSNDGSKLYVSNGSTNYAGRMISVVSTATNAVIASIKMGEVYPHALAISPDDKTLLVAEQDQQSIVEIATATNTITRRIGLYGLQHHSDGSHIGMGDPKGIVFLPGTHKVYVVAYGGDTFGWIDMETGTMTYPNTFLHRYFSLTAIAVVPSTNKLYVAAGDNGTAYEIDTTTDTLIDSGGISATGKVLYVGATPSSIAANTTTCYIVNSSSNDVSMIDIKKNQVVGSIKVGRAPTGIVLQPGPYSGPPVNYQDEPPTKPPVSVVTTIAGPQGVPAAVPGTPAVAVTPPVVTGKPSLPNCPVVVVTPPNQPTVGVALPGGTKVYLPPIRLPWGRKPKGCQ
jgi:YVTN family beta-propeller protein